MEVKKLLLISILLLSAAMSHAQSDSTLTKGQMRKAKIENAFNSLKSASSSAARKDSLNKLISSEIDNNRHLSDKKKELLHKRLDWIQNVDSQYTSKYQSTAKFDTLYIRRPAESITFKFNVVFSGMGIITKGMINDAKYRSNLSTALRMATSLSASYQGIGLSLSFNPLNLSGKNKDYELNVNSYSNRWGFDIIYQDSKTLSGYYKIHGQEYQVAAGDMRTKMLNVNAYYAFNYRKFSFPAAFSQSYIQSKSAGSILVGASYLGEIIKTRDELEGTINNYRLHAGHFAVGAGYGYNLVFPHRWMLHLSALPTLVVFNLNNTTINDVRQKDPSSFPDFVFTERMSLVHDFKHNFFMSYSAILTNTYFGHPEKEAFVYNKWRAWASVGWRM